MLRIKGHEVGTGEFRRGENGRRFGKEDGRTVVTYEDFRTSAKWL